MQSFDKEEEITNIRVPPLELVISTFRLTMFTIERFLCFQPILLKSLRIQAAVFSSSLLVL